MAAEADTCTFQCRPIPESSVSCFVVEDHVQDDEEDGGDEVDLVLVSCIRSHSSTVAKHGKDVSHRLVNHVFFLCVHVL